MLYCLLIDCTRLDRIHIYTFDFFYTVICCQTMSLHTGKKKKTKLFNSTTQPKERKYKTRNINMGNTPQAELYLQNSVGNYSAVFLHLLIFLSVGPQILINIKMHHGKNILQYLTYPGSAGTCYDVLSFCINGSWLQYFRLLIDHWVS